MRLQDMAAGYYEAAQRIQKQIDRLKREPRSLERDIRILPGSLACMGCGYEHNCGVHGCTILREAAELIEKLTDRCARYAEEIAVLQEREKWVPVTDGPEAEKALEAMKDE